MLMDSARSATQMLMIEGIFDVCVCFVFCVLCYSICVVCKCVRVCIYLCVKVNIENESEEALYIPLSKQE